MNQSTLITTAKPRQYKYIPLLMMLSIAFGITTATLGEKDVGIIGETLSIAIYISHLRFLEEDIVAEVYGRKIAIKFFWAHCFGSLLITGFLNLIVFLSVDYSYGKIFSHSFIGTIIKIISIMLAWRINLYFLLKWKNLTNGKSFWLRSVSASLIAEIAFFFVQIPMWGILGMLEKNYFRAALYYSLFRIIFTGIFAVPCVYIAAFLKRAEGLDIQEAQNYFPILDLRLI